MIMGNNLNEVIAEVDKYVNIGDSFLVEEPESFVLYKLGTEASFQIIVQNIRSIYKNFEEFRVFMARSRVDYHIIMLTECWLRDTDAIPIIDNYRVFQTVKHHNQSSGVVVYIRSDLENVDVYEPDIDEADCLIIKIDNNHAFVCIYRSPSFVSVTGFLDSLDKVLIDLKYIPNLCLTGDINIDINSNNNDIKCDDYLDLLATHCLLPTHLLPTRLDRCLDHCFIKSNARVLSIICKPSVTDHGCIFLNVSSIQLCHKKTQKRIIKNINYDTAYNMLKVHDWSSLLSLKDPNQAIEELINVISNTIINSTRNMVVPSRQRIFQPWITQGLLRCLRFRDKLHRKYLKSPNDTELKNFYKRYRNQCSKILHELKYEHDRTDLNNCKNNIKKTWHVIKRVCNLNTGRRNEDAHELFKIKETPQKSVDFINSYFVGIGTNMSNNILKKLQLKEIDLINKLKCNNSPMKSFVLLETDELEVCRIIKGLKNTNSTGWDGISSVFIKRCRDILIKPLTSIFNMCLSAGRFPNMLKQSIVVPIYKSGEKKLISNYRPISLLPTIAKILEKIINIRLINYLEKNSILSKNQFGFRKNKSTVDAIDELVTKVASDLDRKKKCVGIFVDLAKAFDTVSISLLIRKLEATGIRGTPLELFKDYLCNRTQIAKIGDMTSSRLEINFGIPQGSVLGPTLFLLYINDLCNIDIPDGKVITFADDTVILIQQSTWAQVKSSAEQGFRRVTEWLDCNLLTLNLDKTKYITFSIKDSLQPHSDYTLKAHSFQCFENDCDCFTLHSANSIRYLGIEIDKNLNWKQHISSLKSRIRKLIPIFKKIRNLKDEKTNKTVYLALCQ